MAYLPNSRLTSRSACHIDKPTEHRRVPMLAGALLLAATLGLPTLAAAAPEVDEDAAVSLAKKSNCFKCHSVDKRKKAPSYKDVAAKFKDRPDSEAAIVKHLTESPMVKAEEGEDERHATIAAAKDDKGLLNLVRWILSR